MRNLKYIYILCLLCTSSVFAEEVLELFIQSENLNPTTNVMYTELEKESIISRLKYNPELSKIVEEKAKIRFNLLNKNIEYKISKVKRKGSKRVSFSGSISKTDTISIADNNGRIVGSIHHNGKLYKLRPAKNGDTLITEVPMETLKDHDANYTENFDTEIVDRIKHTASPAANDTLTEVTVIVAYTANFATDAGDVNAYMDLLELETNTAFENSAVNIRVKIVHAYETGYQESGDFLTDASILLKSSLEFAELKTLRDNYQADIMMMLTGNNLYENCGLAMGVGVNKYQALAFVRESCATGYYSFGHEIGHLFGARHIITEDDNTTPYAYGHGYCNLTEYTWRTTMAYNCPLGTGGPRIQQWSNPVIHINDEATGTADLEYNAKVLNVRAEEVSNFGVIYETLDAPNTPVGRYENGLLYLDWNDVQGAEYYQMSLKYNNNDWRPFSNYFEASTWTMKTFTAGIRKFKIIACTKRGVCSEPSPVSADIVIPPREIKMAWCPERVTGDARWSCGSIVNGVYTTNILANSRAEFHWEAPHGASCKNGYNIDYAASGTSGTFLMNWEPTSTWTCKWRSGEKLTMTAKVKLIQPELKLAWCPQGVTGDARWNCGTLINNVRTSLIKKYSIGEFHWQAPGATSCKNASNTSYSTEGKKGPYTMSWEPSSTWTCTWPDGSTQTTTATVKLN